ncbi:MAG: hypothetical protein HY908_17980, partial [Myxococcales bacterium]|nr:hypothetical protein [Myxococcales bacterium]
MRAHDRAIQSFLARELRPAERVIGAALVRNEPPTPALERAYGAMPPPLVAYLVPTTERLFVVRTALAPYSGSPRPECHGIEHAFEYRDIERLGTRGGFGGLELDVYLRGQPRPHAFVVWDECKELGKHGAIQRGFVRWFEDRAEAGFGPTDETPLAEPFAPASTATPAKRAPDPVRRQGLQNALVGLAVVAALLGGGAAVAVTLLRPSPRTPTPT